jgi:hypothetical protein
VVDHGFYTDSTELSTNRSRLPEPCTSATPCSMHDTHAHKSLPASGALLFSHSMQHA